MLGLLIGNITKGQALQYMFMPQVVPRLHDFYRTGFANLAYMVALVYRSVNLLPSNHPVFSPGRRRTLGLREVLGAAAAELKFSWKHIDQIVVYFAVVLGMILLAAQFFITLAYIMANPAMADAANNSMPSTYAGFFETAHKSDVAYRLLLTVFGVDIFTPGGGGGGVVGFGLGGGNRSEYHVALHALFQFYSTGLLVIAVFIICYYIFAVLAETAETGVPFGKRYNHVWAPIRLVVALGLLIPAGYGLNSAQWITLYTAKLGSDFATRGWVLFNNKMNEVYLNKPEERVAIPNPPGLTELAANMMMVDACAYAYEKIYGTGENKKEVKAYLVRTTADGGAGREVVQGGFEAAHTYFNKGDILIRFGVLNQTQYKNERGYVFPYCGDIVILASDTKEPGSLAIQAKYYDLVAEMFANGYGLRSAAKGFIDSYMPDQDNLTAGSAASSLPAAGFKQSVKTKLRGISKTAVYDAVQAQRTSSTWTEEQQQMLNYGWGGAGIWYNKIAQVNGSFMTAVQNVPEMRKMPDVVEKMKSEQLQQNQSVPNPQRTQVSGGRPIRFTDGIDQKVAVGLETVSTYWQDQFEGTNNIFIDVVNLLFGTSGLFDMCSNTDVHPLAQLSTLGKGLVETSIRNLGLAVGIGAASFFVPYVGVIGQAAASMFLSVASITITIGFLLFYVIPFMPFLYFFFAVGGWVKGIFEAMVGVPLWALAHLRIDGEGLPGDAAADGYKLILEIFLRPIIIIFGLLASIIIFSAMVKVLNQIYSLVVVNLSGHEDATTTCGTTMGNGTGGGTSSSTSSLAFFRGPIDQIFFTVIYAIIVYMIGLSCFKLIDLIPNNILRFMGAQVQTFNDAAGDPASGMLLRLSAGGKMVADKVVGGEGSLIRQGGEGSGHVATAAKQFMGQSGGEGRES